MPEWQRDTEEVASIKWVLLAKTENSLKIKNNYTEMIKPQSTVGIPEFILTEINK